LYISLKIFQQKYKTIGVGLIFDRVDLLGNGFGVPWITGIILRVAYNGGCKDGYF
jgi:hypothetical protein